MREGSPPERRRRDCTKASICSQGLFSFRWSLKLLRDPRHIEPVILVLSNLAKLLFYVLPLQKNRDIRHHRRQIIHHPVRKLRNRQNHKERYTHRSSMAVRNRLSYYDIRTEL